VPTVVDNRDNLKFRFQEFFTSLGDQGVIISDDDSRAVPFNHWPNPLISAGSAGNSVWLLDVQNVQDMVTPPRSAAILHGGVPAASMYAISYSKDGRIQCFQTVTKAGYHLLTTGVRHQGALKTLDLKMGRFS
jgi:hypothetical protein